MSQPFISLLQSPAEEDRLQGLKGLSKTGVQDQIPALFAALGDESWRVRKEAAGIFLALPRAGELAGEIVELLHSPDNAGLRNTAVEILISLGRRAVPFLLEELSCADRDVRKFALDIMGEIGSPSAIPAMIEVLQDSDENVRAAAAENLGKLRAQAAVPALIGSLERPELLFRFTVLEALGQIGAAVPAESLLPFWEEELLRKALVDCFGRVGGAKAIPLLIEGVTDRMRNVREAAVLALARFGAERPSELAEGLTGVEVAGATAMLGQLLDSSSPEVQQAAAQLIPCLGDGGYARHLLGLLEQEELRESAAAALISLGRRNPELLTALWPAADERARTFLAYLYGEGGCESASDLLLKGLQSDEADLRCSSAQALGRIGQASALAPLTAALADCVPEVREAALQSLLPLCRRYGIQGLQLVAPLFDHEDPEQRMFAATLSGSLEGTEAEQRLALALKDESPLVRRAAVRGFEGRVGGRNLSSLALVLTDEDAEVRRLVVDLLGTVADRDVLRPLELALQDEDSWVRAAAVRALGRRGHLSGWIETAFADPVGLVVIAALEVLADQPETMAGPLILKMLSHADEEVVRTGMRLLSGLPDQGWIESIRADLLHHPHREVRFAFAELLINRLGDGARGPLEERLLVEGDDLVRQHIRALLAELD